MDCTHDSPVISGWSSRHPNKDILMTRDKFNEIINHLWYYHEFLTECLNFDYPDYGSLKTIMYSESPEAVDAMQSIWECFIQGDYKKRSEFSKAYELALINNGEIII